MKKTIAILLSVLMFLTSLTVVQVERAEASTGQIIILNGALFRPQLPLEIVNDRLLVPLREFGEAMGTNFSWDPAFQRITMFRDGRYSIMHIGAATVQYGEFAISANGTISFTSQNFATMEAPAILINNSTYIPLRAMSEALGATVHWNPLTSTATISTDPLNTNNWLDPNTPGTTTGTTGVTTGVTTPGTGTATGTTAPSSTPGGTLPANYGDFTNTSHFAVISSRQAQARFLDSNNVPFILVVYDSTEHNSRRIVPEIQDAAQRAGNRIYGLDLSAANNNDADNAWMWNFIRQSVFTTPAIFYVYSRNNVQVVTMPSVDTIDSDLRSFAIVSQTGMQVGDFRNTTHFRNITSREAERMYDNDDEFVLILYDSFDNYSRYYVPIIKAAARSMNHRVYAVDIDINPLYRNHLEFLPGMHMNVNRGMPMMFLVYSENNRNTTDVYDRPRNVATAEALIEEFLDNSLHYSNHNNNNNNNNTNANNQFRDFHHNQFRNTTSDTILQWFQATEEFIVVVYDGNNVPSRATVEAMSEGALLSYFPIYAVNLSSTVFNNNRNHTDLSWLRLIHNDINMISLPIIIHFDNQRLGRSMHFPVHSNLVDVRQGTLTFIHDVMGL